MIARLHGMVVERGADSVVLDVHGVGYLVSCPGHTAAGLTGDEPVTLSISTIVREDAFLLYGFETRQERDAFDILRSVKGVGPKHALAVLDTLSVEQLQAAITGEDLRSLTKVSGVGKRLAQRLCLELANKPIIQVDLSGAGGVAARPAPRRAAAEDPLPLALAQLDYKKREIDLVLASDEVPQVGEAPLEQRLSAALRILARHL